MVLCIACGTAKDHMVHDMNDLSNYDHPFEPDMTNTERLYVVCEGCGEAFEHLEAALDHQVNVQVATCNDATYQILPEHEAF